MDRKNIAIAVLTVPGIEGLEYTLDGGGRPYMLEVLLDKAIASGDQRLMRKAGLEADIARLVPTAGDAFAMSVRGK